MKHFKLDTTFLTQYQDKQPKFGPIGLITYKRTYARPLENGKSEEFWQTIQRVVEGTFNIQYNHSTKNNLPWDNTRAQKEAQRMYELIWDFKFIPPGRGLWMMGTDYVDKRGGAAVNNCAFVSTKDINKDFAEPFCFLMDMSMLGVGVGGDTKGAGTVTVQKPIISNIPYKVQDSREGWVDLVRTVLNSYVGKAELPKEIDVSEVRQNGAPIKTFGGVSSGPKPLTDLVDDLTKLLDNKKEKEITSTDIVDIFNLIGKCVVSGNVRRSAEIMFGDPEDEKFMSLKDPTINQEALYHHRWASNNSIFASVGMDYSTVAKLTAKNGEPGYEWLENARAFGRTKDPVNWKDIKAAGGNPCLEQTLESYELCCLVETFPSKHESLKEWHETLYYALLYAKSVTLLSTHNEKTNEVMSRNRRIGCSISGITQAFTKFGKEEFFNGCDEGYAKLKDYDKELSERFNIPESIKLTSVKPSGTVSLLAGVTPGIHYPQSEYYIRNVRFQDGSPLLEELKNAGYPIEKDKYSTNTFVVSFPVKEEFFTKGIQDISMLEQLENAALMQYYWADNQVSVTISFSPEEANDIKKSLDLYDTRLKGVSFLPKKNHGYEQAPYIPITKELYESMTSQIKNFTVSKNSIDQSDKFCDGESCQI